MRGGIKRWRACGDSRRCLGSGDSRFEMDGRKRGLYSVMSTSIPSSGSTRSSVSAQWIPLSEVDEGETTALDEPGTPMSGQRSLGGDEIVTGGEKPKGGKTGGES